MGISRTCALTTIAIAIAWPVAPSRAVAEDVSRATGVIAGVATTKEAAPRPIRVTIDPAVCGQSLPDESIASLLIDRGGMLWIGGQFRGIAITDPHGARFRYIFDLDGSRNPAAAADVTTSDPDATSQVAPAAFKENAMKRQVIQVMTAMAVAVALAGPASAQGKDIVDTAVAAGQFKTLAAALKAAGLVETLKNGGPFTVFAPTDEAFAKLPKGTVEDLLKPENKAKLTAILTYHVVAGKVTAADVVKVKNAKTVQGGSIKVNAAGGKVMIDSANVVKADIGASNGVIHVVDSVLMPR